MGLTAYDKAFLRPTIERILRTINEKIEHSGLPKLDNLTEHAQLHFQISQSAYAALGGAKIPKGECLNYYGIYVSQSNELHDTETEIAFFYDKRQMTEEEFHAITEPYKSVINDAIDTAERNKDVL